MMRHNRVKIINLSNDLFTTVLNWWLNPCSVFAKPVNWGFPDDAVLTEIRPSSCGRYLQATYYHHSWDPVPSGERPPEINHTNTEFTLVELMPKDYAKVTPERLAALDRLDSMEAALKTAREFLAKGVLPRVDSWPALKRETPNVIKLIDEATGHE